MSVRLNTVSLIAGAMVLDASVALANPSADVGSTTHIQPCDASVDIEPLIDNELMVIETAPAENNTIQIDWRTFGGSFGCEVRVLPPDVRSGGIIIIPRIIATGPDIVANIPLDVTVTTIGTGQPARRLPRGMSGGQRQRVTLSRSLTAEPELFLADEPLADLKADIWQTELGIAWNSKEVALEGVGTPYSVEPGSSLLESPYVDGVRLFQTEGAIIANGEVTYSEVTGGVSADGAFKPEFPNGYPGFPQTDDELRAFVLATLTVTAADKDDELKSPKDSGPNDDAKYTANRVWELFEPVCVSNGMRQEDCEPLFREMMAEFGVDVVAHQALLGWDRFEEAERLAGSLDPADIKAARNIMERATY